MGYNVCSVNVSSIYFDKQFYSCVGPSIVETSPIKINALISVNTDGTDRNENTAMYWNAGATVLNSF
jgi:hypothetical protein